MENVSAILYLVAAVLFILSLKGLSSPTTAIQGNRYGILGMLIAVATTFMILDKPVLALIAGAIVAGGAIGAYKGKTVEMTGMPELVAAMHSLVGLSAVLIAVAAIFHTGVEHTGVQKVELFIGAFIGAITFTASVVAYGKLSGKFGAKAVNFSGQHLLNLVLALAMVGFGVAYFLTDSHGAFLMMVAIALVLGVTLIIPVLIIAGACVGSSGAILSYIMCKAMNRSIVSVLLGGFGAEAGSGGSADTGPKNYKSGSAEDATFLMSNADSVIIVPGYGLAVSRAQHALQEFAELLHQKGVNVRYAIHPVAGRMPGHMNVLLAEAEVTYEQVQEMEEINSDFSNTDVVLVIGANDVVNPAAQKDKQSPIYGMPILEAHKARTVIVVKRSMSVGYSGLDNELFDMDKTMMVFGDAKKVVEDMLKAVSH